jgi:hypothetical protein
MERYLRDELRRLFGWTKARRSQQYMGATGDAADITVPEAPWLSVECKAVSRESVRKWMEQCIRDAEAANKLGILCHKVPRGNWLVTLRLDDLPELVQKLSSSITEASERNCESDTTCCQPER